MATLRPKRLSISLKLSFKDFLSGYMYVPMAQHPGIVMMVKTKTINDIVGDVVLLIFKIWPLLLVNTLMIVIAGHVIWMLVSAV